MFANPYTGAILGEGSQRTRAFFRNVTDWHRWLGAKGDNRNVARAITGACNLGFLFLVMSGFYLWWPRNWNLPTRSTFPEPLNEFMEWRQIALHGASEHVPKVRRVGELHVYSYQPLKVPSILF